MSDLETFKKKFDPYLKKYLDQKIKDLKSYTKDPYIFEYINHVKQIAITGGKRIRPFMAYASYLSFGGKETKNALKLFVAIEVFHIFALIHDDIIDQDTTRHGIQTSQIYIANKLKKERKIKNYKHIGNSQSILLGDLLFNWCLEIINLSSDFDQEKMQRIKRHFFNIIDQTIIGQMLDVDLESRDNKTDDVRQKNILKTASYSCVLPLLIGASLAKKLNKDEEKFFEEFGITLGIAFQTQDDLLDITSTDKQLQKTTSLDKSQHQHTYFTYFKSLKQGKEIIENNLSEAKHLVKKFSINENAKRKFFDLIEIIENRKF